MPRALLIFRWIVFLLAAFYCLRMIFFSTYDAFSGPFRFLTVWALFASFFCASRMIARMEGRTEARYDAIVATTAVLNVMVVILFWRLFFQDPTSIKQNGTLNVWWLEYYLHGLGPALQWIDALFLHRSFRRPVASAACLMGIVGLYILWIELVVHPLSDTPVGTVTSGLPYPFLNNLTLDERLPVYGGYFASALVMLALFSVLAWVIRRLLPRPEAR